MAQCVRMHIFDDAGLGGVVFDHPLNASLRKSEVGRSALFCKAILGDGDGDEQRRVHITPLFQIAGDGIAGIVGEEDDPEFGTFATDAELAFFQIDMLSVERSEFGDAQSCRKKEFENGSVSKRTK